MEALTLVSWIHETDMNRLFERALTDANMQGIYIATAPKPVSQRVFMREPRRAVGMPIGLPAFQWMVRIATPLLGTDPELALYGRYLVSRRLREMPFEFTFLQMWPMWLRPTACASHPKCKIFSAPKIHKTKKR
jgi:NAD dependent epimerase/dehydratase family enzyme